MTFHPDDNGGRKASHAGFSLVEVVLALGVSAFALTTLLGLIPGGIGSAKDSVEESRALNLLGAIVSDRSGTPSGSVSDAYSLPVLSGTQSAPLTGSFGVGDDNQITANFQNARFRIDYRITPSPSGQRGPAFANFRASWPAMATSPRSSVEIAATFPQQ